MSTKYFYIMGAASGVGKSTLCEGLLLQLLHSRYQAKQLAYIKPMTQCTDKQPVTKLCEQKNIRHRSIGSLVFEKGFTKDFIDGLMKDTDTLLDGIVTEITQIGKNKDIVIIDGIGGVSTGSVVGVSNVDIALALHAPVLYIGNAGIGSAIDDTIQAVGFLQYRGIKNIALAFNKIKSSELAHVKHYLDKRLAQLLPDVPLLDCIAIHTPLDNQTKQLSTIKICRWFLSQLKRKTN